MFLNIEYKNILSTSECNEIADEFKAIILDGKANIDQNYYYDKSLGYYNLKSSLKYLSKIEKIIFKDYQDELTFSNTYIRKYEKLNYLKPHIDKPGLDVTLSMTVDGITHWPLCVSNLIYEDVVNDLVLSPRYQANHKKYYTDIGDGVACYGRNTVHWREKLDCKKDEYLIQIFYHWSFV